MEMTIRPMEVRDIRAGLELCRLSGWNQLEEDWRLFLCDPNGGGSVVVRDGEIAGTVTVLRYGMKFSWLSMMLVHPDARRGGLGRRLMATALEGLAGETCVRLDATPLGEPLYRGFGFTDEFELVRAKVTGITGGAWARSEDVRPIERSDLGEVFARDREIFGADRSAVLTSFYRRAPELAWSVRRGRALAGYCFGRPGHLYRQLGPVVAYDMGAAADLVALCIAVAPGQELAIDAPCLVPEWIGWLESAGFRVERRFLRMYRGQAHGSGIAAAQFAIAGPEFG